MKKKKLLTQKLQLIKNLFLSDWEWFSTVGNQYVFDTELYKNINRWRSGRTKWLFSAILAKPDHVLNPSAWREPMSFYKSVYMAIGHMWKELKSRALARGELKADSTPVVSNLFLQWLMTLIMYKTCNMPRAVKETLQ